jgi:hypothetical protein
MEADALAIINVHVEVLEVRVVVREIFKIPRSLVFASTSRHPLRLRAGLLVFLVRKVVVIVQQHSLALSGRD